MIIKISNALSLDLHKMGRKNVLNLKNDIEVYLKLTTVNQILLMPIDEIGLSVRTSNCLVAARIRYVNDLVRHTKKEIYSVPNFGKASRKEVEDVLAYYNLSFYEE